MKNNRGSSLILVIVCIAFAGILGATVLMASATNRDMKLVDEKAKENFYLTESGLDIFLANLSQMAEETMGEAYTYVLTHYSADNDAVLKKKAREELFYELTYSSGSSDGATAVVRKELLEKKDGSLKNTLFYGMEPEKFGTEFKLLNLEAGAAPLMAVVEGDDIVLKNVSVAFMENGYETKITTDVRLKVEFTKLDVETPVTISGNYVDYSIISDHNVWISEGDNSTVSGNVYAGKSLVADNGGKLALTAKTVIAGEQIRTERGGSIAISGSTGNVEVWTKNILTVKDVTGTTDPQSIKLQNTDCYVADDMTIGADGSKIAITGNYYGYTALGGGVTASNSSAIVINAGGATLDLSGLGTLWLAGRSSLKVPDVYGGSKDATSYSEIMEGEAISYKGNQLAYLVPGECIKTYEHNPLTQAEYNAIKDNVAAYIDTGAEFGTNGTMTLAPYVASTTPCEIVPVRFLSEPEPLYYVYIKFKTNAAAEEYFLEYSKVNGSVLNTYAEVLKLGEVKLPSGADAIETNGTVLRVNDKHQITEIIAGTISQMDAFTKQSELKQDFSGLVAMLDKDYSGAADGGVVSKIVRMSELEKLTSELHLYFDADMNKTAEPETDGYEVIVSKGNVNLTSKNFKGIVIADGTITVEGGEFSGMLLATGDITMRSVTISSGSSFMKELMDKNTSIQRYFMNYPVPSEGGDGGETANARNISVTLENWIKN